MKRDRDSELIQRIARNDSEALEELMKAYQKPLFATALRLLGEEAEAEDVIQETFLSVWRHAADFRAESSVRSWLYRIALNKSRSVWRWKNIRRFLSFSWSPNSAEGCPTLEESLEDKSIRASPEGAAVTEERSRAVRRAVEALPTRLKEIVLLRCDGMELEEIARVTGLAVGTVKAHLFHARERLGPLLGDTP